MPMRVVCPSCTSKLRAADNMAGRKTKCPKCGTVFEIPMSDRETAEPFPVEQPSQPAKRAQSFTVPPKSSPAPSPGPPEDDIGFDASSGRRLSAAAAISNTIVVHPSSRAAHSLGIAALVVGLLSFFVCWIPFVGIPVSSLGLILGLSSFVLAIARRGTGIGFSIAGSGLSILSLVICLVWPYALSSVFKASDGALARQDQEKPPLKALWTKTNTPEWVSRLSPEVKKAFSNMMNDKSPLYTGIFCNRYSIKFYINRSEWKDLTKFQATNQAMVAMVFPHTDETVIEFFDDKSGERLLTCTPKQKYDSINVVHP